MSIPITVTGRVGTTPERRTTAKDAPYARFRLGASDRVRNEAGEWTDGETSWFDVQVWDALGEHALGCLAKGQRVVVQGDLTVREWTGQDGAQRITVRIRANSIGFDLKFGTAAFTRAARPAAQQQSPAEPAPPQRPVETRGADWGAGWGPAREPGSSAPERPALVGALAAADGIDDDVPF